MQVAMIDYKYYNSDLYKLGMKLILKIQRKRISNNWNVKPIASSQDFKPTPRRAETCIKRHADVPTPGLV